MSENKRYYWIKLKEDFFTDIRMKRLRKLSGGDTYTIIYLKLLLLSLRDEGKLYFERVDESFIKELALVIDETEDDIQVTLRYLQGVGLLEIITEDEYFLTELPNLIGSESDWAAKKRRYREQRKQITQGTMSTHTPSIYGEFKNISLTNEEYRQLEEKLQDHTKIMIDKLSRYIKSSGKTYQSHYATILSWYDEDKEKLTQKKDSKNKIPNYDNSPSI